METSKDYKAPKPGGEPNPSGWCERFILLGTVVERSGLRLWQVIILFPVSDLIESVQTAVDPTTNQGKGVGFAPIGHVVTVTGVTTETVDIVTEVTYQEGWDWNDVKSYAEAAVDAYFTELAQAWER